MPLNFSLSNDRIFNVDLFPSLSFQPISNADFIVPVEIDGTIHQVSAVVPLALSW